jgi:hypothetical protein
MPQAIRFFFDTRIEYCLLSLPQLCATNWGGACPAFGAGCPEVPEGWKGKWGY